MSSGSEDLSHRAQSFLKALTSLTTDEIDELISRAELLRETANSHAPDHQET